MEPFAAMNRGMRLGIRWTAQSVHIRWLGEPGGWISGEASTTAADTSTQMWRGQKNCKWRVDDGSGAPSAQILGLGKERDLGATSKQVGKREQCDVQEAEWLFGEEHSRFTSSKQLCKVCVGGGRKGSHCGDGKIVTEQCWLCPCSQGTWLTDSQSQILRVTTFTTYIYVGTSRGLERMVGRKGIRKRWAIKNYALREQNKHIVMILGGASGKWILLIQCSEQFPGHSDP